MILTMTGKFVGMLKHSVYTVAEAKSVIDKQASTVRVRDFRSSSSTYVIDYFVHLIHWDPPSLYIYFHYILEDSFHLPAENIHIDVYEEIGHDLGWITIRKD